MKAKSLFKIGLLVPTLALLFTACETVTRVPISEQSAHEHTYVYHEGEPATCVKSGIAPYYTCADCNKYFDVDKNPTTWTQLKVPALGHEMEHHDAEDWNNGTPGHIEYFKCTRCHKHYSDENGNHQLDNLEDVCHHTLMQEMGRINPTFQTPGHIGYYYCGGCLKYFYDEEGTDEILNVTENPLNEDDPRYLPPIHSDRDEYSEFNLLNKNVMDYLGAENEGDIINALKVKTPEINANLKSIRWQDIGSAPYTVYLGTHENLDGAEEFTTNANTFTFPGTLIPGTTYYYSVIDADGNVIKEVSCFKVDGTYTVSTSYIDGVHNVRDLGGWTGKGGAQMQYHKLYRGARLTWITDEGKDQFFNGYHIKTEIDLRIDGFNETEGDHNYQKLPIDQYTTIIPGYTSPDRKAVSDGHSVGPMVHSPFALASLKSIFEILADETNYPIYFHCNAGADRTGTLAYLISGLLGVSYEDTIKDFELTSFGPYGDRYRSPVVNGEFQKEGEMTGIFECDDQNYVAFGKLNELIMDRYGKGTDNLALAIENYLILECGLNRETLSQVRKVLLGSNQSFDYLVDIDEIKNLIDGLDGNMESPYKSSSLTKVQNYLRYLDNEALEEIGEERMAKYQSALAAFETKYALATTYSGKSSVAAGGYWCEQAIIGEECDETYGNVYVLKVNKVNYDGDSGKQCISFMIIPGNLQYRKIRFGLYISAGDCYLGYLYYHRKTLTPGWHDFEDDLSKSTYGSVRDCSANFWIRIQANNTTLDFTQVVIKITDIYYEK